MFKSSYLVINLLVLLLASQTVIAQEVCFSTSNSCSAYQCLENRYQCGEKGYLRQYGLRMCETYLRQQDKLSAPLRAWYQRVRVCLQDSLLVHPFSSCEEIEEHAFASHLDCYIFTGYCELSEQDKINNMVLTGKDVFNWMSIVTGLQISNECRKLY